MDLRNKVFWCVFYSLVYGYLMVGLIWQNETPMDSVKNFPLRFKENEKPPIPVTPQPATPFKKVTQEVNKPI